MELILEIRSMRIYAEPEDGSVWITGPIDHRHATRERIAGVSNTQLNSGDARKLGEALVQASEIADSGARS